MQRNWERATERGGETKLSSTNSTVNVVLTNTAHNANNLTERLFQIDFSVDWSIWKLLKTIFRVLWRFREKQILPHYHQLKILLIHTNVLFESWQTSIRCFICEENEGSLTELKGFRNTSQNSGFPLEPKRQDSVEISASRAYCPSFLSTQAKQLRLFSSLHLASNATSTQVNEAACVEDRCQLGRVYVDSSVVREATGREFM